MNSIRPLHRVASLTALALLSTFNLQRAPSAHAQGSLTPPPGAPAPVMKSLDQIEARTPLVAGQPGVSIAASGEITITASGSFYLTTNLSITNANANGIKVGNQSATIDLNGFTVFLVSTNTTGKCISINGSAGQNVTVRNGRLVGGGAHDTAASGILINDPDAGNVLIENVQCSSLEHGIYLNSQTGRNIVRNCTVERIGNLGIVADLVIGCTVRDTVGTSITGMNVVDCAITQTAGFAGKSILATLAQNCVVYRTTPGTAIQATAANGCYNSGGTNFITHKFNMP